jgi:hypothetical protein
MSYTPENSSIAITPELEKTLKGASFEEIKEHLKNAAISQGLAHREWDETIVTPNEPGTAPRAYGRTITVTVNGQSQSRTITADSELALEKAVGDFYRETFVGQPAVTERPEASRDERGRFTRTDDPVAKVELDLKFKRGEISTAEYLEQSGAVAEYLEKQGVPLEDLRAAAQERAGARFEKSWADATTEFLNGPAGNDWPGGTKNLELIGLKLAALGLTEAEDKVAALAQAYAELKASGELHKNPAVEMHNAMASATSHEELREIARRSSGLFGR